MRLELFLVKDSGKEAAFIMQGFGFDGIDTVEFGFSK
jgi:hypothetical protein